MFQGHNIVSKQKKIRTLIMLLYAGGFPMAYVLPPYMYPKSSLCLSSEFRSQLALYYLYIEVTHTGEKTTTTRR